MSPHTIESPGRTGVAVPAKERQSISKSEILPPFRVLLHNDDHNYFRHVEATLMKVFGWTHPEARKVTLEAHEKGVALCGMWSFEVAELYRDQLRSYRLCSTIEEAT